MFGKYHDYELGFRSNGKRFGFDIAYQDAHNFKGWHEVDGVRQEMTMSEDMFKLRTLNVNAYYVFNYRRFSYPAAFAHSFIQRRSAGSWLAGISYQGGSIKTTDELKLRNPESPDVRIYIGHLGIGGGYGYNWVLGKKWLLHFSLLPTFVVYNRNNMTVNDVRKEAEHIRFNMIFNERAAVLYNISPRYFVGTTAVVNTSLFQDDNVTVNQNKWRARAFFGMRLFASSHK